MLTLKRSVAGVIIFGMAIGLLCLVPSVRLFEVQVHGWQGWTVLTCSLIVALMLPGFLLGVLQELFKDSINSDVARAIAEVSSWLMIALTFICCDAFTDRVKYNSINTLLLIAGVVLVAESAYQYILMRIKAPSK